MKTIADRFAELTELPKDKIIATLVLEDYPKKDIAALFPKGPKKTFRTDFSDFIVENIPTKEEVEKWVTDYPGVSQNQLNHMSIWVAEAALVKRVFDRVTEKAAKKAA